ncbi:MAG: serine/threonine protein kinase [Kofleriaceae bacterium]|nr:serine/threonine protein kinase [Kofleriaceae bacterium]
MAKSEETRIGEVIDNRYRIDSLLGRGGMGVVYRGTHIGLRRPVAVKILHAILAATPEVRSRFEREALVIGQIDHPNCVGIYDVGTLPDGSLYLAMEFLEGRTLGALIEKEQQLPVSRVLHIMRHLLHGLAHVHAAGLVHRDIKPENIFLVREGDDIDFAKILDFGIAKPVLAESVDDGVKLTQAGMAFGTPIYMAPEQALGNPLDARADLYALSVMAFELLTGNPPFFSDDKLEVMSMHTARPVPSMASRTVTGGTKVPAVIERMVARGLTKRPADRYVSAEEYLEAIDTAEQALANGIFDDLEDAAAVPQDHADDGSQPLSNVLTETGSLQFDAQANDAATAGQRRVTNTDGSLEILPAAYTHSQPVLLTQHRKSVWINWLFLAMLASALGAGVALWSLRDNHDTVGGPAHEASVALEHGDAGKAIKLIEKAKDYQQRADMLLVLGHARSAKRDSSQALDAYGRALTLSPSLESDPMLRANLMALSDDKSAEVAGPALDMLVGRTKVEDAHARLIAAAASDSLERRRAARIVAEHYALVDKLDLFTMYSLDLEQESSCEKRKEVVANLRAMGDPRAIAPLDRAKNRLGKTGQWRGKPINQCLLEDAAAAIAYLSSLPGAPAPEQVPSPTQVPPPTDKPPTKRPSKSKSKAK